MKRKIRSHHFAHAFLYKDRKEIVQCLGAHCPLCGRWMETKDTTIKPRKNTNLLDEPVNGFGKQSFARRFN